MRLNDDWSNFDEFVACLNNPAREAFLRLVSHEQNFSDDYLDYSIILPYAEANGFTFDYGLDNIPYDFKTL